MDNLRESSGPTRHYVSPDVAEPPMTRGSDPASARRLEPHPTRFDRTDTMRLAMLSGAAPGDQEETLTEQLLRLTKERKWVILQALVVVLAAAFLYVSQKEREYTASASLLFTGSLQTSTEAGAFDPSRVAATNAALIELPAVSSYAARRLQGVSAGEIYESVTVDTGANDSDVATIEAVSTSPERAADIANAYAEGYIEFRRDTERAAIESSIRQLRANLDALPVAAQNGPEGAELRRQISELETAAALRTGSAELVQRAAAPRAPSSPQVTRTMVLAGIVGLVLGLLLAAAIDRFDRRIKTVEDMERAYALPVLAEIPRVRRIERAQLMTDAAHAALEPFRVLRVNLRHLGAGSRIRSLLVVSPQRGDGKSTVARALAATMAAMGDRVLLVDADLHQRGPSSSGLTTVLAGHSVRRALISEPVGVLEDEPRHLAFLPAGPPVANPSELLESAQMHELLRELEDRFELVIIDAPAASVVSDALALVPIVSAAIVVGGLGQTTTKSAATLRRQLQLLDGNAVGLVVNYVPEPRDRYGYHS